MILVLHGPSPNEKLLSIYSLVTTHKSDQSHLSPFLRTLPKINFQVPKLNEGTLHAAESDQIEFANEFFIRNEPDLLSKIKRKDAKRSGIGLPSRGKIQNSHWSYFLRNNHFFVRNGGR